MMIDEICEGKYAERKDKTYGSISQPNNSTPRQLPNNNGHICLQNKKKSIRNVIAYKKEINPS